MICDICADDLKTRDAVVLSPKKMRQAARNGFGATITLAGYAALSGEERRTHFQRLADENDTDWAICRSCASNVQAYLEPPAAKAGQGQRPIAGIGLQPLLALLAGFSQRFAMGDAAVVGSPVSAPGLTKASAEAQDAFRRIGSGDFKGAREFLLLAILNNKISYDALCLLAFELVRPTTDPDTAKVVFNALKNSAPHMFSALNSVAVLSSQAPQDEDYASTLPNLIEGDAARGPHEAAVRLFALVMAATNLIMVGFSKGGIPEHPRYPGLLIGGAIKLYFRAPEMALDFFRAGVADPAAKAQKFREVIGSKFDPRREGELRAVVERVSLMGEALALRELGRYGEALIPLQKLKAPSDGLDFLLIPLIAEATELKNQPPFPAAWRTKFLEGINKQEAMQARPATEKAASAQPRSLKSDSAQSQRPVDGIGLKPTSAPTASGPPRPVRASEQPMKSTHLVYSRGNLVKKLLIGTGLIGAGIAIAVLNRETGYKIWGAVLGLFGLGQLGTSGHGGTGPCPCCGNEIKSRSNSHTNRLCPGCHHYLTITNLEITELTASTVTAEPTFAVPTPWADLKNVAFQLPANTFPGKAEARTLEANWPHACCVCGQEPTRSESWKFTVYKSKGGLTGLVFTPIVISVQDVPYCPQHTKGFKFDNISFTSNQEIPSGSQDFALVFRNFGYRNAFLAQNPWPWV